MGAVMIVFKLGGQQAVEKDQADKDGQQRHSSERDFSGAISGAPTSRRCLHDAGPRLRAGGQRGVGSQAKAGPEDL